jgi:multiple sugar transport system substrate-binding protein
MQSDAQTTLSRRAFLRLMGVAGGAAVLGACGAGTPASAPSAQPTAASAAGATAPAQGGQPITIEYYNINSESFGLPAIREQIAAFQQRFPNITVQSVPHQGYNGLITALQAALAARRPPAVAQIGHNFLGYLPENSIPFTPVESFVEREPEVIAGLGEPVLALGRHNGTLDGMPYSLSTPILYANSAILDEAGLDPQQLPGTLEELRAACTTIKERTGSFGLWISTGSGDYWCLQALVESNGGRLLDTRQLRVVWDEPDAVAAMQWWGDLAQADQTLPVLNQDEGHQSFMSGDIAMVLTSSARLIGLSSGVQAPLTTAPHPTFGSKARRLPGGGNSLYIFASDPDQQAAAWEWIKFLMGPEGHSLWIKGTGYVPLVPNLESDPQYLKPFFDERPQMQASLSALPDVVPWTVFPGRNSVQIGKVLTDARDLVLAGQRDAQAAFGEAATQANQLIMG